MTDTEIVEMLWDASNLIVGFVGVETLGFAYACGKPEFGDAINTKATKRALFAIKLFASLLYTVALWWCGSKASALDPSHADVHLAATGARIVFIFLMMALAAVALYARQFFRGAPYDGRSGT